MSGIVAILNRDGEPIDPDTLRAMLSASAHRAVDGQNVWIKDRIALGHQHFRLSPEEHAEVQPLAGDSHLVITCDARLDNRAELIRKLEIQPASSPSDATLVLTAYEKWNTTCVDHLLGDFAFAIWDGDRQQLFLARDALGVRDLCYYIDDDCFLAASEIKQILAHPMLEPRINERKVAEYLASVWDYQKYSFYRDIFYCRPGHCLLISAKTVREWRYWDIEPQSRIRYRRDAEYSEHFRELFSSAVRDRLRVSGDVAVSLSGGPDSASVAAVASMLRPNKPLKTFSYVFDQYPSCDERRYIEAVVDHCHLDATYLPGDEKWPLQHSASWPVFQDTACQDAFVRLPLSVMQAAQRAGCRVLLSGHFSDVLFAGGNLWAADMLHERRFAQLAATTVMHFDSINLTRDLLMRGLRPLLPESVKRVYRRLRSDVPGPLRERLHPNLIAKSQLAKRVPDRADGMEFPTTIQRGRYNHLLSSIHPQGAAACRALYNAHGLELVDPFWDRRLVEFAMAVPADQLGRPHQTKWVLRKAVSGLVPDAVRTRADKTSLHELYKTGLLNREHDTVRALLRNPQIVERDFIRADWLQRELNAGGRWSADGYFLWLCLTLELWLQRYW